MEEPHKGELRQARGQPELLEEWAQGCREDSVLLRGEGIPANSTELLDPSGGVQDTGRSPHRSGPGQGLGTAATPAARPSVIPSAPAPAAVYSRHGGAETKLTTRPCCKAPKPPFRSLDDPEKCLHMHTWRRVQGCSPKRCLSLC